MTQSKSTKRALLASVLSLLVCLTMLIGSTFAWFTDTASAGVSAIQAGTLDIDLVDASNNTFEGRTVGFKTSDNRETIFWEPGCRYELEEVKLVNNGNLNAKFKVVITATTGTGDDLSKVIDVYEGDKKLGTLYDFINKSYGIKEGVIAPSQTLSFGTLTLVMQETAGNEYQGESISGIAITVYATQTTVEKDSIDDQYDKNALYPTQVVAATQNDINNEITNANGPVEIVLDKGTYNFTDVAIVNKDITFSGDENVVFDMSAQQGVNGVPDMIGTNITFEGVTIKWSNNNEGYQGVKNPEKVVYKDCVIEGTQFMYGDADFINCTFKTENGYAVYTRAAGDYTFTNCNFITGGRAVMMYSDYAIDANVTMTNCTFSDDGTYTSKDKAVVETGDGGGASKYSITLNNCTITNGFEENNSTSKLWGNKDSMPKDRLNVVINGVDVY